MTEDGWLTCEDPNAQVAFLFRRPSPRKLRLWACACGRELLPLADIPWAEQVLTLFEDVGDGPPPFPEVQEPFNEFRHAVHGSKSRGWSRAVAGIAWSQWIEMVDGHEGHFSIGLKYIALGEAYFAVPEPQPEYEHDELPADPLWRTPYSAARRKQAALARDIFGNPFRPVLFNSAWRTPVAVSIATKIYADRAFDRMPILADALEDAGCDNAEVLNHCRKSGPHARGCWIVDLILENV